MSVQPYLEIHLHLVNGNIHKFTQNDPSQAELILSQFNLKLFALPSLIIYGDKKVVTYQGSSLLGVTIIMKELREDVLQVNENPKITIKEITQENYITLHSKLKTAVEGEPLIILNEIEFVSGKRLWLEGHIPHAAVGIQMRQLIHNWFQIKSLLCHSLDGGLTIWSRAHMLSCTLSPTPDVPLNSWPADSI